MNRDYFVQLYNFTDWANRKIWACVMHLSDTDFMKDLDYSQGSIFNQVTHTMEVEYWWVNFLSTRKVDFLDRETYPTRDLIRARWDKITTANQAYVASLTDAELQRNVHPDFWDDDEPSITVAEALTQVAFHSMDHRAQTLAMLHKLGAPTVGQDFLGYLHREYDEAMEAAEQE